MSLKNKILALSAFAMAISDVNNQSFGFGESYKKNVYSRPRKIKKTVLTPKQKKARTKAIKAKQARKINYKNKLNYKLKNKQYEFKETFTKFKISKC